MKEIRIALICVPVCERRASDFTQAIARAAEVADIIELRLDCLAGAEFDSVARDLDAIIQAAPLPVILTLRPAEQGGQSALDYASRRAFWSQIEHIGDAEFIDLELDLALDLMNDGWETKPYINWDSVICSHHDFARVPDDLEKNYERMASTPARILKVAVQSDDITDCIPVFQLLQRARREGREMIAIAMGEAGIATRILACARGQFLTYGATDAAHATAPGQISAKSLRDLYRIQKLNRETEITGLIGSPVAHSVSPHIHNAAFEASGVNAVYIPFEVRNLNDFLRRMVRARSRELEWNLRGFSVTAPHKSAIMPHLDWIEPSAVEIGAVNTVVVINEKGLCGYNTDAGALLAPLREKFKTLKEARVAVIGAGGAARSALWSLHREGGHLTIFARQVESAYELAEKFNAKCEQLAGASFNEFDLIINATPLGTRGRFENQTPAVAAQLRGASVAYDLVYNPPRTRFMREARAAGCEIIGGLPMLVAQASAQFTLWTGKAAPIEIMRRAAEVALEEQTELEEQTSDAGSRAHRKNSQAF